jgi:succinate-semialdehyde dehydrogenase/glutarate-semialdehyde dehydrogenase
VLGPLPPDARLLGEEIFGTVAPIVTFFDEDEAVAAANDTDTDWSPMPIPATSTAGSA